MVHIKVRKVWRSRMVKGVIFHAVTWLRLNFTASYSLIVLSFFTVATFGTANLRRQGVKNSGFLGLFWTMANYFHGYVESDA